MFNLIAIAAVISALLTFPIAAYADAKSQIATAAEHAGLAAAAPNLAQTHVHLHHAMNCLVGPLDADFDKGNMNPCAQQGKGAFPDASDPETKTKLQNAMSAAADGIASKDEATAKKNAATVKSLLDAMK
jgi:hypothetical protein